MDHDLIVVGGGPVGLSLARAVQGLSVGLVARGRPPQGSPSASGGFDARVYALTPGNLDFLRALVPLAEDRLTPVYRMIVHGDGNAHIEFDAYRAGVPALAWIAEDRMLQAALWQDLPSTLHAGECEALAMEPRVARLALAGGATLAAKLVVGADGAASFVRRHAGIRASESSYGQAAVVANFHCTRAHQNTAYQWFQGGPVLALLPLPGDHVSMVWSLPADEALRVEGLDAPRLCEEVRRASGGVLGELALVTPQRRYALQQLSAERLVAPRVALVGDAAHVIHPLAGQGLNLGLQDVRVLLRVLEEREPVRDLGDYRLLRRYERSRAEPILAMDTVVDGLYRLFGAPGNATARLRNSGLNLTDRMPVLKNILIRQAMS